MPHQISANIVYAQFAAVSSAPTFDQVAAEKGLDASALRQGHCSLFADEFASLMRACFEKYDDEALGFTHKPLRLGTFRMMCHATLGCYNLRRALLRLCDYFRLLSDEFDFRLLEQGYEASLLLTHTPKPGVDNGYFIGMLYIIFWRYLAWLSDGPLLLHQLAFKFTDTDWQQEAPLVFGCPVYFQQSQNKMVFSSHYLNSPIRQDNQSLVKFLADAPECLLSHYRADDSYSAKIRNRLSQLAQPENVTLDVMAQYFACSSQSLSRKLRKEGHSFQQLKDKVRKTRTINLLLQTDLSISEVSQRLGFSEDAVFYRTFKKWTGLTPSAYRKANLG